MRRSPSAGPRSSRREGLAPEVEELLIDVVADGFVLTTASAGHRTADAFPGFVARHGYDVIVYSGRPLPQMARLPHVVSMTPVPGFYSYL